MSEWPTVPLSEFVTLKRGMDLPARERRPGPFKVLSSGETSGWHDEGPVQGPGFVIGRATNIGRPTWSDDDYWPLNTVLYVTDFQGNDPKFAYYWFLSQDLSAFNSGSVQPMLNRNYIAAVPVLRPPIEEQRRIAGALGVLDEKIRVNKEITATCLDLAEAQYKLSCADGSDLMPLKDTGKWLSGGTPSTSRDEFWGGVLPWISSASLRDFFVSESPRTLTAAGASAVPNIVPPGTILFVVRGMSLKSEFRVGITQREVAFGQDCKAIVPALPPALLAIALRAASADILRLVDEAGHGTGRLPSDLIGNLRLRIPRDKSLVSNLEALFSRGAAAARESRQLESLRDLLLPGLLTGRLRARETDHCIATVDSRGGRPGEG